MLAWIKSPRGSTSTATVVAVILALFWLAPWQKPLPASLRLPFATSSRPGPAPSASAPSASIAPAVPAASGATPALTASPPAVVASLAPSEAPPPIGDASSTPNRAAPAPGAATRELDTVPAFDVVRVEPTGEAVIAGRAAPGSDVALMDGETVIAHVKADANGQFAFVPPSLADGSHYLSLQTQRNGQAPVRSQQGVAVALSPNEATKPMVALISPDKPAEILSDGGFAPSTAASVSGAAGGRGAGSTPARPAAPATSAAAATPVAIQSVQAGQNGNFLAAGVAHPGSQCRVYLNGAYLADVTAGQDGKWSVEIKKGMQPGRYTVRADELDPAGRVSHRAEVPFEYPETIAAGKRPGAGRQLLLGRGAPAGAATSSDGILATSAGRAGSLATTAGLAAATPAGSSTRVASTASSSADPTLPSPATAVIPNLHTTTVIRGDSLWRISRKMLGHGIQYTEIYASNTKQIRDPGLIYPGQIFVVPSKRPNG